MIPYFYKIKHLPTGTYYIGSQYGKEANPKNFWVTYFTSSKHVKSLVEKTGKDSFQVIRVTRRADAREYESNLLKRLYKRWGHEKFMSQMINRNIAPGILLTEEIIAKANEKRRISNSAAAKKLLETGCHNFQKHKAGKMQHVRLKRAERMKGNKLGALKKITDEFRQKQSLGAKGNTNVRGTKWWTNIKTNEKKRCIDCPGEGWMNQFKVKEQND